MHRSAQLALTVAVLLITGMVAGAGTYAAFSSTTLNQGNTFASGTVSLADNDASTAMLAMTGGRPGSTDTSCIQVTYTGNLDATVKLYSTVSGQLAPYLNLSVTRGTETNPTFDNCATFAADAGGGVMYSGLLSAFPATYAAGLTDGAPETWTNNEKHSYRFTVALANDNAAQGKTANAEFTWEAQNQ